MRHWEHTIILTRLPLRRKVSTLLVPPGLLSPLHLDNGAIHCSSESSHLLVTLLPPPRPLTWVVDHFFSSSTSPENLCKSMTRSSKVTLRTIAIKRVKDLSYIGDDLKLQRSTQLLKRRLDVCKRNHFTRNGTSAERRRSPER